MNYLFVDPYGKSGAHPHFNNVVAAKIISPTDKRSVIYGLKFSKSKFGLWISCFICFLEVVSPSSSFLVLRSLSYSDKFSLNSLMLSSISSIFSNSRPPFNGLMLSEKNSKGLRVCKFWKLVLFHQNIFPKQNRSDATGNILQTVLLYVHPWYISIRLICWKNSRNSR